MEPWAEVFAMMREANSQLTKGDQLNADRISLLESHVSLVRDHMLARDVAHQLCILALFDALDNDRATAIANQLNGARSKARDSIAFANHKAFDGVIDIALKALNRS